MKSLHRYAPFLFVALFLSGTAAFSQDNTGTIQGILLDGQSGNPLRGVSVRLIGSEVESKTDIKGGFTLTVPAGSYAGIVVSFPRGRGLSLLEAEVPVEAGVTDDLHEIEVFPSQQEPPEGSPPPQPEMEPGSGSSRSPESIRLLPWLGIVPKEMPADYGPRGGSGVAVLVDHIFRGSPAEKAGFQTGDFIDQIGERPVTSAYDLFQLIAASPLETPIEIRVDRRGELITLTPRLIPVPEAALMAIRELSSPKTLSPPSGATGPGAGPPPPPSFDQGTAPPIHPILQEARRQAGRGNFQAADGAYAEYLASHPQEGLVWAEYAEMVFHNIQNAKGMQLMAQAVKKPGLPPSEKTRLRLLIARRRLESGNLITAQQMLLEAKREDPYNPFIDDLLQTIEIIVLQSSGRAPGPPRAVPYNQPGGQVDANQILINELLGKISKELAKEE